MMRARNNAYKSYTKDKEDKLEASAKMTRRTDTSRLENLGKATLFHVSPGIKMSPAAYNQWLQFVVLWTGVCPMYLFRWVSARSAAKSPDPARV